MVTPADIRSRLNPGRTGELAEAAARNLVPEHRLNAAIDLKPGDEFDGSTMTLESLKIKRYDRNPRRSVNPNREEIKESVKVKGILNSLTVTRRPGSQDYMVYGGGNTRLEVMQELAVEYPGNRLYSHMTVTYRAWKTESDVITAHLIENELRGDTTFWDKACGLISLKKEFEAETDTPFTSNDVRLKAAALGWKVSRDTVQLYDFATERLAAIGPWLKHSSAKLLKDRVAALSACMRQLDTQGGPTAFNALLADELALQEVSLKALQDGNVAIAPPEADAVLICTALEERVAAATGTSVPELRQMLAILATNPQTSAAQLRSEASKGVVVAKTIAKHPAEPPATPGAAQILLPTPMLAAVRPKPQGEPGAGAALSSGLPSIESQGSLPPELSEGDPSVGGDAGSAPAAGSATQASQVLHGTLQALAANTFNSELFVAAPNMPLGYFMELPVGTLGPQPDSTLPPEHQIRLRRAGWQLLAMLSCQFDRRCCTDRLMPAGSRWLVAALSPDGLGEGLWRCGVVVHEGQIQLDAACLFYLMTEPRLLAPAVLDALSALAARRSAEPNLLPPHLDLITCLPAMAA